MFSRHPTSDTSAPIDSLSSPSPSARTSSLGSSTLPTDVTEINTGLPPALVIRRHTSSSMRSVPRPTAYQLACLSGQPEVEGRYRIDVGG